MEQGRRKDEFRHKSTQEVENNMYRLLNRGLTVNFLKPSYQSNKDETYFRARLALMIKPALSAISAKRKALMDLVRQQPNITSEDLHVWIPINMASTPAEMIFGERRPTARSP